MDLEDRFNVPYDTPPEEEVQLVTAVFPHPLHGRLIERLILWVQPSINYKGWKYVLSWWGGGVAYYHPA